MGGMRSRRNPQVIVTLSGESPKKESLHQPNLLDESRWKPNRLAILILSLDSWDYKGAKIGDSCELDNGKVGKLCGDQKITRECYYVNLKSLRNGERTPPSKTSQPDKVGKKATIEMYGLTMNQLVYFENQIKLIPPGVPTEDDSAFVSHRCIMFPLPILINFPHHLYHVVVSNLGFPKSLPFQLITAIRRF
ncbi:hypothetical protein Cgig2_003386 [Carnegiea gigantea]|uniref:Uncharacterized protein n=1 Tax=Carnegiea gigantea TaxID=171969 RepID=A0A9Q1JPX0_9CARY|nr:hypothetical protein Cgig2_003386 [Carnegiea gigantea]